MKITTTFSKKIDVRLPKAFKKKWIKALRSGQFEQGEGYLEDDGKYCCLGVACRIMHPKMNLTAKPLINSINFSKDSLRKIKVPAILKGSVDDFDDEPANEVVKKLTTMNDNGVSFSKIADWIEKNL